MRKFSIESTECRKFRAQSAEPICVGQTTSVENQELVSDSCRSYIHLNADMQHKCTFPCQPGFSCFHDRSSSPFKWLIRREKNGIQAHMGRYDVDGIRQMVIDKTGCLCMMLLT